MTEREALMRSVIDDPDDDAPRLVFADWLDENGEEDRAAFIRLSIARAKFDDLDPAAWVLDTRLAPHRLARVWAGGLPELTGVAWSGERRGFAEEIRSHSTALPDEVCDAVLAAAPVRRLHLIDDIEGLQLLAGTRIAPRLHELTLDDPHEPYEPGVDFHPADLGAVLASEPFAGLRHLAFRESWASDVTAYTVAQFAPPGLESLTLIGENVSAGGVSRVLESPRFPNLRELRVAFRQRSVFPILAPLHTDAVRSLVRLVMSHTELDADDLAWWMTCPFPRLRFLNLAASRLNDGAVRIIARSNALTALAELDLRDNSNITDAGLRDLAESDRFPSLRSLRLGARGFSRVFTAHGIKSLEAAKWLPQLTRLEIVGHAISRRSVERIAAAPLRSLRWFSLESSGLDDASLAVLLAAPWINTLTHINLSGCRLLRATPLLYADLPSLVELDLSWNPFVAEGAANRQLVDRFGDRVILRGRR